MEIKPLGTEVQILILKRAKNSFWDNHEGLSAYRFCRRGLCNHIQLAFKYYAMVIPFFTKIKEYIPIFTYENACKYSENTITGEYWWEQNNYIDRLLFLDWMIQELEKQLNN